MSAVNAMTLTAGSTAASTVAETAATTTASVEEQLCDVDDLVEGMSRVKVDEATAIIGEAIAATHLQPLFAVTTTEITAAASVASITTTQPILTKRTGILYDERCLLHQANYQHVEQPSRASESFRQLLLQPLFESHCTRYTCRPATDTELLHTHAQSHIALIDSTATIPYSTVDELDSDNESDTTLYPDCRWLDSDTYVGAHSSTAARLAVGGLIDLCSNVITGVLDNGFAIIRPPGHHSDVVAAQGFCLYNNVAIAAAAALVNHPLLVQRVAIIDWDVHHGNGTQNMFYSRADVLYFSVHRYQRACFYPYTGAATDCGLLKGIGHNINMPFSSTGMNDAHYEHVFQHLLLPILRSYQPQLLLISAGFDCAHGDPLGGNSVTPTGFRRLTQLLLSEESSGIGHKGRVVMALEGGYNVSVVAESVVACVSALTGQPQPESSSSSSSSSSAADNSSNNSMYVSGNSKSRQQEKEAAQQAMFVADLHAAVTIQQKHWPLLPSVPAVEEQKRGSRSAAAAAATIAAAAATTTTTATEAAAQPGNWRTFVKQQQKEKASAATAVAAESATATAAADSAATVATAAVSVKKTTTATVTAIKIKSPATRARAVMELAAVTTTTSSIETATAAATAAVAAVATPVKSTPAKATSFKNATTTPARAATITRSATPKTATKTTVAAISTATATAAASAASSIAAAATEATPAAAKSASDSNWATVTMTAAEYALQELSLAK